MLGAEHTDTLNSVDGLAWIWKSLHRNTEAIKLMEECVRLRTQVLGSDHPDTLLSLEDLDDWKSEDKEMT